MENTFLLSRLCFPLFFAFFLCVSLSLLDVHCVNAGLQPGSLGHAELAQKNEAAFLRLDKLHHRLKLHPEMWNFLLRLPTLPSSLPSACWFLPHSLPSGLSRPIHLKLNDLS